MGQNGSHTRNGDFVQNIDRDVSRMVPIAINHSPLTALFLSSLDIIVASRDLTRISFNFSWINSKLTEMFQEWNFNGEMLFHN